MSFNGCSTWHAQSHAHSQSTIHLTWCWPFRSPHHGPRVDNPLWAPITFVGFQVWVLCCAWILPLSLFGRDWQCAMRDGGMHCIVHNGSRSVSGRYQCIRSVSGWYCNFGRPSGVATWSGWIYSQGVYFPPRAGGEARIFGFYNNKQTNKKTKKQTTQPYLRGDRMKRDVGDHFQSWVRPPGLARKPSILVPSGGTRRSGTSAICGYILWYKLSALWIWV